MGPRVWAGLALVLLALAGLAAVLPQGQTDFNELRPDKFRPPFTPSVTPPLPSELPEDFDLGSFVKPDDFDTQFDLEDLPDFQQFRNLGYRDLNGNGRYDPGEPLFMQKLPDRISAGDLNLGSGGLVPEGDALVGQPTQPLENAGYAFHDTNGDGAYTPGEAMYLDADGSGSVTAGDVRLSDADKPYAAQSLVRDGDADLGRLLNDRGMPGLGDERYYDRNGNGRLDEGDPLYLDVDDNGNPSNGDLRMGPISRGDLGPSGGLSPEELAMLAAAAAAAGLATQDAQDPDSYRAGPTDPGAADYASDRDGEASGVTCIRFYSYSSTCHNRGAAYAGIQRTAQGQYLFLLDDGPYTPLVPEPAPPGTVESAGDIPLRLERGQRTPLTSIAPDQRLVRFDVLASEGGAAEPTVRLVVDENDMVWAETDDESASILLRVTWAIGAGYFDPYIPAGLTVDDVPLAMRPQVAADVREVGLQVAAAAGANRDQSLYDIVVTLRDYFAAFGEGPIPDESAYGDDMLAIAYGKNGCCRHRAEAFTVAAQSLGVPTRMVVNEAHAFSEVYVPGHGWRMIDLGGCGSYSTQDRGDHEEIPTDPDTPVRDNLSPEDEGPTVPAIPTTIEITSTPDRLRRGQPFDIGGTVTSSAGPLPAGVPITYYYNRTKDTPGTHFCTGATDGTTAFRTRCTLPADAPVGDFQLVARVAPSVRDGQPTAASFSDPPFSILSASRLLLEGPSRTVLGSNLSYGARLLDDAGKPIEGRPVQVSLDGVALPTVDTDGTGRAPLLLTLGAAGAHTLQARFAGDDHYDAASAGATINALNVRLEARVENATLSDNRVRVTGTVRDDFGPMSNEAARIEWNNRTASGRTNAQGRIDLTVSGPIKAGAHRVRLSLTDLDAHVDLAFVRTIDVTIEGDLPRRWSDAHPLRLQAHVETDEVDLPVDRLLVLVDGQPAGEMAIDANGNGTWASAAPLPKGPRAVSLALPQVPGVGGQALAGTVDVGTVALAATTKEAVVAAGAPLHANGTLRFNDRPLGAAPVRIELGNAHGESKTDDAGRWRAELTTPAGLPLGNASLRLRVPDLGYDVQRGFLIGRPTVIDADLPRVAWRMGGSISFTASVQDAHGGAALALPIDVRSGDEAVAPSAGRYSVGAGTWFVRSVPIEVSTPGQGEFAAASTSRSVLVVNPVSAFFAFVIIAAAVGGTFALGRRGRAPTGTGELALAPALPTADAPATLLRPALPPGVPPIFDPAHDGELAFAAHPAAAQARVTLEDGMDLRARLEKGEILLDLKGEPEGRHTYTLDDGVAVTSFPHILQPFHKAVDEAMHALAARVQQRSLKPDEPVRLTPLEQALQTTWKVPGVATRRLRSTYEDALYAREDCTRAQFEAFFAALHSLGAETEASPGVPA